MRGTDARPLAAHLPHPAQQELAIAAAGLDLAKDRFDDRFAPGVAAAPALCPEGAAPPTGPLAAGPWAPRVSPGYGVGDSAGQVAYNPAP